MLDDDGEALRAAAVDGARGWPDLPTLMDAVSPLVTVSAIGEQAGRLLMLHAGAVVGAHGAAVALVGPSGAGKTTAVRALAATLGYLTDETVAVRADGTIAAYPKPLSVITPGVAPKAQISPDDAGLAVPASTCHLERVLLLDRDGSPEPWLEPVPVLEALAALAPETSYLTRVPAPLHRLADVLGPAGLHRLHYADAADLLPVVAPLVAGPVTRGAGRG